MKKLLLTSAVAALIAGPASAVVIDNFDLPQNPAQQTADTPTNPPTNLDQDNGLSGVIGQSRDIDVQNDSGNPAGTQANNFNGDFNVANGPCCTGKAVLTWDGAENALESDAAEATVDTFGLGGVDLFAGTINNRFVFDLVDVDENWSWQLELWDSDSLDSVSGSISDGQVGSVSIPFSSFSGIDFTNVGAIQFELATTELNGDIAIDDFRTVGESSEIPLPASLPMLLAGMGGLGFLGWRRARKA